MITHVNCVQDRAFTSAKNVNQDRIFIKQMTLASPHVTQATTQISALRHVSSVIHFANCARVQVTLVAQNVILTTSCKVQLVIQIARMVNMKMLLPTSASHDIANV